MFPFDQTYKLTAEEDPRGAITLVRVLNMSSDADVQSLIGS